MHQASYRISAQSLHRPENIEVLVTRLECLLSGGKSIVLAVDGRAASGKSRLAGKLAENYAARLVHTDDFFLPQKLRTAERMAEVGGTLHYERFMAEILPALHKKEGFSYQAFDCSRMQLGQWRRLLPAQLTLVEGSYALHPKFGVYYDLSIFMSCSPNVQLARLKARNPAKLEEFQRLWLPQEEKYFHTFGIENKADLILET